MEKAKVRIELGGVLKRTNVNDKSGHSPSKTSFTFLSKNKSPSKIPTSGDFTAAVQKLESETEGSMIPVIPKNPLFMSEGILHLHSALKQVQDF